MLIAGSAVGTHHHSHIFSLLPSTATSQTNNSRRRSRASIQLSLKMLLVYIKDEDKVRCMFKDALDKFCLGKFTLNGFRQSCMKSMRHIPSSTNSKLEKDLYIVARGIIPKNAREIKIMEDDIQPGFGGFQPGQPASSRRFGHKTQTQRLAAEVVFARIKIPKWVYWARKICQKPFPEIIVVLPKNQGIRGRWMN